MRVTSTIKNYIREQVSAKFPTPKEVTDYNKYKEEEANFVKKYNDRLSKYIKSLEKEIEEANTMKYLVSAGGSVSYGYRTSQKENDLRTARNNAIVKRDMAIDKAVNNIIVTLELGGNRADLDRMISEIGTK